MYISYEGDKHLYETIYAKIEEKYNETIEGYNNEYKDTVGFVKKQPLREKHYHLFLKLLDRLKAQLKERHAQKRRFNLKKHVATYVETSYHDLAKVLKCTKFTIKRVLDRLVDAKIIQFMNQGWRVYVYFNENILVFWDRERENIVQMTHGLAEKISGWISDAYGKFGAKCAVYNNLINYLRRYKQISTVESVQKSPASAGGDENKEQKKSADFSATISPKNQNDRSPLLGQPDEIGTKNLIKGDKASKNPDKVKQNEEESVNQAELPEAEQNLKNLSAAGGATEPLRIQWLFTQYAWDYSLKIWSNGDFKVFLTADNIGDAERDRAMMFIRNAFVGVQSVGEAKKILVVFKEQIDMSYNSLVLAFNKGKIKQYNVSPSRYFDPSNPRGFAGTAIWRERKIERKKMQSKEKMARTKRRNFIADCVKRVKEGAETLVDCLKTMQNRNYPAGEIENFVHSVNEYTVVPKIISYE